MASPHKARNPALNPSLPRPPPLPRLSTTARTARSSASPTKKSSSFFSGTGPSDARSRTPLPPSPSKRSHPPPPLPAKLSDRDPETSDEGFSSDDERASDHDAGPVPVPVRRKGFGKPTHPARQATARGGAADTDREDGFTTAKEGSMNSMVEHMGEDDDECEDALAEAKKENIVVCLRIRPSRASATAAEQKIYTLSPEIGTLTLSETHPTLLKRGAMARGATGREEYEFRFDALHLSPRPTEDLYNSKVRPVVRAAMKGFNGTVFAYGQTASGKTHTMMGTEDEPGIIPLAIHELFDYIHNQKTSRSFSLRVSFLEIYNEQFRDLLLSPAASSLRAATARPLEVHGDDGTVKGLEERPVSMPEEVLAILAEGDLRRRTGATDWNERSSRSHSVFMVTIESMSKADDGVARTSRLNLIDLAGSESATGQEERRKEGSFINKSLLTLGTVIGKLTERSTGATAHIPYRDSKLTRLLQPALSGNSRVTVICTISPDADHATESLSTLKFAKRAKMVVTKAERGLLVTNQDQMMLKEYQSQVAKLQAQIAARESEAFQDDGLARERDSAMAKVDELHSRNKKAEEELASKDLELARLREQLEHTKSFILTGPVLEANARRVSGQFGSSRSPLSPMRSLGYGTPRGSASSLRISSAATVGSLRVGTVEKELALELQLADAEKKLAALTAENEELAGLRTIVSELQQSLSLAQLDAEKSSSTSADRKRQVQSLQKELDLARAELGELARVRDELERQQARAEDLENQLTASQAGTEGAAIEMAAIQKELLAVKEEASMLTARLAAKDKTLDETEAAVEHQTRAVEALRRQLADCEEGLREAQTLADNGQKQLKEAETRSRSLERKLVVAKELDNRDAMKDLEHEISFLKKDLTALALSKTSGIQAAEAVSLALRNELAVAIQRASETDNRLKELQQLADVERQTHDRAAKDREAALVVAEGEVADLRAELKATLEHVAALQRSVDSYEAMEAERKRFATSQRAGTDALKQRMTDLKNQRSATPTPTHPSSGFPRPASRSSSSSSTSSVPLETFMELQNRNDDLVARLVELERAAASPRRQRPAASSFSDAKEHERLNQLIRSQSELLDDAQKTGDQWRAKYVEMERKLEKLTALREGGGENDLFAPRLKLAELNTAPERRNTTTSSSATSPAPRMRHTASLSSPNLGAYPPPLPASPRNLDQQRKIRRETISKEMQKLKEAQGVARTKELLDSPSASSSSLSSAASHHHAKASWSR